MTEAPTATTPSPIGSSTRRIILDIDPGSDPISGGLDDGRGTRRFSGWLELADALQAAIALPPEGEEPPIARPIE